MSVDRSSEDELLTVAEVADYLRVSERFVRKLIAEGRLPAAKVGARVVRVRRREVSALLQPVDDRKAPG